ncbi:amino acid adenylation domain-containing protein [Micromonospora sp. DR5-3]|nr:non-ribosomal peptide synthetase/type I polyketide synthase [Micromonospora sp. DR5-3]MCW3815757.1 amino acid adenylation domain-containing protein [Micromonospora sp. DR5-3]
MTDLLTPEKVALLAALRARRKASESEADRIPSRGAADGAVASYAQRQMWYLSQLSPGAATYLVPSAYRLCGPLDAAALGWALDALVARHAPLRTTLAADGDCLTQAVAEPRTGLLRVVDLAGLPAAEREAEVQARLTAEPATPVDLAHGPVLRATLLRTAPDEHVLLLTVHHVAVDEWSLRIFHAELGELYAARRDGRRPNLPELAIGYGDYAAWQHDWLTGPEAAAQLDYWRDRLAGAPAVLELPTTWPRPAVQSAAGVTRSFPLDVPQDALLALCQRLHVTPYMALLAAFQVLISRYTGERDVVIGTPVANRRRVETEHLIGLFVNPVPIRTALADNPSFEALVHRVRAAVLDAQEHQELPFEKLVEALRPVRDPSHSPLFQVMFLYGEEPASPRLSGVDVSRIDVPLGTAQFDLTLLVRTGQDGLGMAVEYRTDLFDAAAIERLAGHYRTLLTALLADPAALVGSADLLTADEWALLETWNDTDGDFPHEATVHGLVEQQVVRTPEAPAVTFDGRTVSFAELNARANQVAHRLRAAGVGPETLVGVCAERSVELVVGLLGVLKAGGAYVPLDPEYPAGRLGFMVADAAAPVVLVQGHLRELLPRSGATVLELDDADTWAGQPTGDPPASAGPANLAYVIYTSGSTGRPKGVPNTHRGAVNRLDWMQRTYRLGGDDVVLQKTPVSFDVSVWEFFWPLQTGARLVLAKPGGHKDPAYLRDLLVAERVTTTHFVPSMLTVFLGEEGTEACTGLRRVICSGEELPLACAVDFNRRLPGCELHNLYGPTEAAIDVSAWHCTPQALEGLSSVPIGAPISNLRLHVLDPYGNPAPIGVAGELHIGGVGLARGYHRRPALTAERFIPDPFTEEPGARLYRTGDRARWRADRNSTGVIEFLGRIDHQVKLRGLRIELGEIESALREQDGVTDTAVIVREDTPGDKLLVAYLVGPAQTAALKAALRDRLPEYMVPNTFVTLDALPLTPNGKLDRRALPPPATHTPAAVPAAPVVAVGAPAGARADLSQLVVETWREVLDVPRVGVQDNFFDLGGHSMRLLAVHRRLRERLGDLVTVTDLFRYPTVDSLTRFLTERADGAPPGHLATAVATPAAAPVRVGAPSGAIAVVGLACRFPAARTVEEYWRLIFDGAEAVREFTVEEALADGADPGLLADPAYVRAGTVLPDIDRFDAAFFGFTPREAQILDPQHRLLLECVWEALEHAGYDPQAYAGQIGLFAGSGRNTYFLEHLSTAPELIRAVGEHQLAMSNDKDFLATRISYKLNLTGPSISVSAACATSLVAVHMARQSLLTGESDIAVAGGVTVFPAQRRGYLYHDGGLLSPDGHCRPFDADARGAIASSGAGVVVLKRLEDAIADGDLVHAVIRGSAVNNDGARRAGYAAPGVHGQVEVVSRALAAAGVDPRSISYLEAHGTGTQLGDPIEVTALTEAFRRGTADRQFCALGSVKANIGHTDAAAGVAGLIKAVLALRHRTLPPTVNITRPNPSIDLGASPFYLNDTARPWPAEDTPRRAGVNSFGIGGTNVHIVLEEAPARIRPAPPQPGPRLLVLSAHTAAALHRRTEQLHDYLSAHPEVDLGEVAAALARRQPMSHRRFLVSADREDALTVLGDPTGPRLLTATHEAADRGLAFAFPGYGAQHAGIGAGLYRAEPAYRAVVDECAELLLPTLGLDLRPLLCPEPAGPAEARLIEEPRLVPAALFVTEYALARLLMDRGVRPELLAGHGVGEYVAACLAGVFPPADALRLVCAWGRLTGGRDDASLPEAVLAEFRVEARRVDYREPQVPLLSGLTGKPVTPGTVTDPEYWVRHLRESGSFAACAALLAQDDLAVAEVGPGQALGELARQAGVTPGRVVRLMRDLDGEADEVATLLDAVGRLWLAGVPVDGARLNGGVPRQRLELPSYPFERQRYWVDRPTAGTTVSGAAGSLVPGGDTAPHADTVNGAAPVLDAVGNRPALGSAYVSPRDEAESQVVAIWQELLGIAPIGADDNVFELGADSLLVTRFVARVHDRLGVALRIETVFAHPTAAGVAAALPSTPAPVVAPIPRAAADAGPAPLSSGQHRLWFLDRVYDEVAYTMGTGLRLDGDLDVAVLRAAVAELVRRHEVLRTVFVADGDGDPVQVVLPTSAIEMPVVDMPADAPIEPDIEPADPVYAALLAEIHRPFDLASGPLFRPVLFRLAPDRHILSLTMHHNVSDGWSLGLINTELAALYDAFLAGRPSPLPELAIQYHDFARWQRERLASLADHDDMRYWLHQLDGVATTLELPTDRPRPPVQTFKGAVCVRELGQPLTDGLRRLGQQAEATLFMTLLAAFQTLMFRYSGQRDICVGTPVAGRVRAELEPMVGFFVNMLALRTTVDDSWSFTDLLAQVRRTSLEAYDRQEVPFERVVDAINVPRDLSRNPLFQVMFNLLNVPEQGKLRMGGLHVAPLDIEPGITQQDLALYAYELDEGLRLRLEYNCALFDAATAEQMMAHLETLLAAVVADPSVRLSDMDIMTPADRHRQLAEWNDTARPAPTLGLVQLFEQQVDAAPDRPAVTFEGTTLSYAQLNARANRLAHRLRRAGVGPDLPVAVSLERSDRLLVALLGVLKAGGAYVPLDPSYPLERQRYVLEDSGATVLVAETGLAGQFPDFVGEMVFCDGPELTAPDTDVPDDNPVPLTTLQHLAYVIYTSGSTGRPKGVRIEQASLVNLLAAMRDEPGFAADDTMLAITSYAFDISTLELFLPLIVGARVVMASREAAYDATRLAALIEAETITVMQATPATWRLLLGSGWAGNPGLRAFCGGEAMPAALARDLAERVAELWNLYGPTEATVWSTAERIERGAPEVTIGRPIANTQAYLLDTAMRPVPVGVVGELYLGGLGLARDYLDRQELTAERFVPDPFHPDGRLYRTGDLGRYRRDGRIEFLGRNDSQVKVHGYRIELGEIEATLQRHPTVRECAVVVREDGGEPAIVAYLALQPDADDAGTSQWRAHLRTYLPDYMVPVAFVVLDALPLTDNRKVDRKALPAWQRTGAAAGGAAPQTPLQHALASRWAQVLGYDTVGIDDDFFDLGGDSFKAINALRGLDTPISVLDLFRFSTIRSLTEHVESSDGSDDRLLHELTPPRSGRPATLTVIGIPFAGGGAATFRPLAEAMPGNVALYALERPGHDLNRADERQLSMDEITARCVAEVVEEITGPVVVYGHCIGGAIAVELGRQLEEAGVDLVQVVIGAHFPAPRLPGRLARWWHRLFPAERWTSKRTALENLRALGFFTDVLDKREKEFVMRVALSDWAVGEDYYTDAYADGLPGKLRAPIVCVIGDGDRATELFEERYLEWEFFADRVSLEVIESAGHYFAKNQPRELADIIVRTARRSAAEAAVVPAPGPALAVSPPAGMPTVPAPRAATAAPGDPPAVPAPTQRPPAQRAQASLTVFYLVAIGQLVSLVGTGLTSFGLSLWVYQHTGSISMFATAAVLALLPAVALSPIAGAVADRWNRRLIMVGADSAAATGTVALGLLLWLGELQLWQVFAAITVTAVSSAFQQPAYLAAVTQLVPKRYYGRANGMVSLGGATSSLLAPLIGGALVIAIGLRGIVLIDLLTFAFAVTIALTVRFPDSMFKKREETFRQEIVGGWRFITRRHGLLALILLTTLLNYFFSIVEVLATPLTLSFGDPSLLGTVLAASGVGLLLGSVVMSVWGGTERRTIGILSSVLFLGISLLTVGLRPNPLFPALGLFGMGLATALVNTHWLAIVQAKVGLELQGRVLSTGLMLSWMTVPAGFLTAAPLADNVFKPLASNGTVAATLGAVIGTGPGRGIAMATIVAGLCTLLLGAAGFAYRPIRRLEDELPDADASVVINDKDRLQELADRRLADRTGREPDAPAPAEDRER